MQTFSLVLLMLGSLAFGSGLPAETAMQQSPTESARLSVSRATPYFGEQIELTLTIRTTSLKKIMEMRIPWLSEKEAWSVRWQFLLMPMPKSQTPGLLLRFRDVLMMATPVKPGEYVLRWKLVIAESETRQLSPIHVGDMTTNALTLQFQRPPNRPASSTSWNLGVGSYRVAASWSNQNVVLGDETTLNLSVEGAGTLELLSPPPWRTLPGWESDRFLMETGQVQWNSNRRIFSIRVRPRQLRAALPPVLVTFFDPSREQMLTQQVAIPPLKILAARQMSASHPGSTVNDALNHLPDFQRYNLEQHASIPKTSWGYWLLLVPAAGAIVIIMRKGIVVLAPTWVESLRWNKATRQVRYLLSADTFSVHRLRQALLNYFSIGLDRTVKGDLESLNSLVVLSPRVRLLKLVLEQLQLCEFGPENVQNIEQLRQLAHQFVQASQEAS